VIDFEIKRDPDRPNGEIAKIVRCSVPAVLKARKRLAGETS
jgi:DNA-binding Lrp family transcriptional regulator